MFHQIMAVILVRKIYKLKQKLENHLAHYYNYRENVSNQVGKDFCEDYYINNVMKL